MKENEVGKFLRLLTHDLQNQLGAIDLNLQVIPSIADESNPAIKQIEPFVSRASLASSDMIETLNDVQAFARMVSHVDESGGNVPVPEKTALDLTSKVQDCLMILASSAKARQIELQNGSTERVTALGVSEDVRRALKILATDLLRGSFPGSTITLTAKTSDGHPQLEIESSQEGLFEQHRITLAMFLAGRLIETSGARLEFAEDSRHSRLKIVFPGA